MYIYIYIPLRVSYGTEPSGFDDKQLFKRKQGVILVIEVLVSTSRQLGKHAKAFFIFFSIETSSKPSLFQQMPGHMLYCSKSPMTSPLLWVFKKNSLFRIPRSPDLPGCCVALARTGLQSLHPLPAPFSSPTGVTFFALRFMKVLQSQGFGLLSSSCFGKPQLTSALTQREAGFWTNGIHQASSARKFEIMTSRPCRPKESDQVEPRVGLFLRQDRIDDSHVDLSKSVLNESAWIPCSLLPFWVSQHPNTARFKIWFGES